MWSGVRDSRQGERATAAVITPLCLVIVPVSSHSRISSPVTLVLLSLTDIVIVIRKDHNNGQDKSQGQDENLGLHAIYMLTTFFITFRPGSVFCLNT